MYCEVEYLLTIETTAGIMLCGHLGIKDCLCRNWRGVEDAYDCNESQKCT